MIAYRPLGPCPRGISAALFSRIATATRGVSGIPSGHASIGVRFVTSSEIRRLNRQFRGYDRATDVLSFSAQEGKAFPSGSGKKDERELGDIVICTAYATREAKRRSMSVKEELVRLIVHGTLHLAGWDHATERDEAKMFARQERMIETVLNA